MARQNPLVPLPPVTDPMQAANSLLSLGTNLERYEGARRENQQAEASAGAIQEALTASGGKLPAAISHLEQAGRWGEADTLRTKAAEIKTAQQEEIASTFDRQAKGLDLATRYLQGIEAAPEAERARMFDESRQSLLEAIPEALHEYVPPSYDADPGFVGRAIPWGLSASEAATRRANAVTTLNEKLATAKDQFAIDQSVRGALAEFAEHASSAEDMGTYLDQAMEVYGASPVVASMIGPVPPGEWDDDTRAQVAARLRAGTGDDDLPSTIQAALVKAYDAGDQKTITGLLQLQEKFQAASQRGSGEGVNPTQVRAVLEYPEIWGDLTPTTRDALLTPLAEAGFDFSAASQGMTQAQKATVERWKADQLAALDEQLREGLLGSAEEEQGIYNAEKARIEQSYRAQMGTPATRPPAASSRQRERVDRLRQSVLPPERGGIPRPQTAETIIERLGDKPYETGADGHPIVTLKDGTKARIESIDNQGKIQYTRVPERAPAE